MSYIIFHTKLLNPPGYYMLTAQHPIGVGLLYGSAQLQPVYKTKGIHNCLEQGFNLVLGN